MPRDLEDQITAIRHFNRFYTRHVGALKEGLLDSPYSLTEMRILYELAHHAPLTAGELSDRLRLDPGYVSRLLAAFSDSGLLDKTPAKEDKRRRELRLSAAGMLAFAPYDRASREETAVVLAPLSEGDRERLVNAMAAVEEILSGAHRPTGGDRPARPPARRSRLHRPPPGGALSSRIWLRSAASRV